jgi:hypothetical protein
MDKRAHHMTDPSPNRLDREDACATDRHPPPMTPGKPPEAPPPLAERVPDKPKAEKR